MNMKNLIVSMGVAAVCGCAVFGSGFGALDSAWTEEVDLADAKVSAKVDGFTVTLSTDKPAFFVWANAHGVRGEFSDNSFTLLPGRPATLTFAPGRKVSAEAFRRAFSVFHLRQTY